jgi:FXSXX-COOH protein
VSPFLSSPDTSEDRAASGARPIGPAEDRPGAVTETSALGHVLRRLAREAAHPDATYPAEFESSLPSETRM